MCGRVARRSPLKVLRLQINALHQLLAQTAVRKKGKSSTVSREMRCESGLSHAGYNTDRLDVGGVLELESVMC